MPCPSSREERSEKTPSSISRGGPWKMILVSMSDRPQMLPAGGLAQPKPAMFLADSLPNTFRDWAVPVGRRDKEHAALGVRAIEH